MSSEHHKPPAPGKMARRLIGLLLLAAAASLLVELLVHRHSVFDFERWFGFYALFGFVSYVVIVRAAMLLRRLLQREEDYYD